MKSDRWCMRVSERLVESRIRFMYDPHWYQQPPALALITILSHEVRDHILEPIPHTVCYSSLCKMINNINMVFVYRKKRDFELTNALITWACSLKLSFSCLILWELCISSCLPSCYSPPQVPPHRPKLKPTLKLHIYLGWSALQHIICVRFILKSCCQIRLSI